MLIALAIHVVLPPWLLLPPWAAFLITLALPSVGVVLAFRRFRDPRKKFYLGKYVAFWGGEGICAATLAAITSAVLDGETPKAFYTELWFYLLFIPLYIGMVVVSIMRAKKEEADGRDPAIFRWASELYHTFFFFPGWICLVAWSIFPWIHYHPLALIAILPAGYVWYRAFIRDEEMKDRPKTKQDWTGFVFGVMFLAVAARGAWTLAGAA